MKFLKIILIPALLLAFSLNSFTQTKSRNTTDSTRKTVEQMVKSSAAYTEILLKKTELEAELEDLLVNYTLEYPKVKEIQFQLGLIKNILDKLFTTKPDESQKLTTALGKLIVQKLEHETELWQLKEKYSDEHPEVKKAKRKVLVYESAIKDVLF